MKIYKSEFNFGPEATKKQSMLFETDVSYAASEGYNYIQPANGPVFLIDGVDLIEVDLKEEKAKLDEEFNKELNDFVKALGEAIESEEPVCKHCDNIQLIDGIINNTLSAKTERIEPQSADTMIKLAQLQNLLIANHE